jgi:GNAT superfamily N-acetyltransferase
LIQLSTFAEILQHTDLLAEYAEECSISAIGPINPQPHIYEALEKSGIMQCFGVFDGEMIGFGNVLMTVLPHYGRKLATIESLFVSKAHRNSNAGIALMEAIETHVKAQGCEGILYSAPAGGKLERLLEGKKQYQRTNAVFFRSL